MARADVSLTNEAVINVRDKSDGSIAINSRNLEILEGSKIRAGIASGFGSPQSLAGNVDVNSTETVTISGANTFISNAVVEGAVGKAGDVNITTESLSLSDGGQANSLTQGQGDAGNVNITASDIFLDGSADGDRSGFFNTVASGAVGDAGETNIKTGTLSISNGAIINANTFGQGNAGNIFIEANDSISLINSNLILSLVRDGAIGNGGNIEIQAKSLSLINGSQVASAVFRQQDNSPIPGGQGNGGNINITTTDFVNISGVSADSFSSGLFTITEQGANGQAGDITVNTNILRLSSSGNINSATRNSSNGGNITINAESLLGIEERPQNSVTNDIDASSGVGLDGTVSITTPDVDVLQSVIELPSSVVEPEQTVAQVCEAERGNIARSGLTLKGKGGIPPEPTAPLNSDVILTQQQNPQASYPDIKPIKTSIGDIMLARGVIKTESGEIILTAYPTDNRDRRTPSIKANCS